MLEPHDYLLPSPKSLLKTPCFGLAALWILFYLKEWRRQWINWKHFYYLYMHLTGNGWDFDSYQSVFSSLTCLTCQRYMGQVTDLSLFSRWNMVCILSSSCLGLVLLWCKSFIISKMLPKQCSGYTYLLLDKKHYCLMSFTEHGTELICHHLWASKGSS